MMKRLRELWFQIHGKHSRWAFTSHAVTWDEINAILDLVPDATPYFSVQDDEIIHIINEEAGAYYSGQKSADDVISIIQNRVQLYVNENK